ncbi:unnamed protein product [Urochloa humidicola]
MAADGAGSASFSSLSTASALSPVAPKSSSGVARRRRGVRGEARRGPTPLELLRRRRLCPLPARLHSPQLPSAPPPPPPSSPRLSALAPGGGSGKPRQPHLLRL